MKKNKKFENSKPQWEKKKKHAQWAKRTSTLETF